MTARLTHIALHPRDLPACAAFPKDFCGLRAVRERGVELSYGQPLGTRAEGADG